MKRRRLSPELDALLRPLAWSRIAVGVLFLIRTTGLLRVLEPERAGDAAWMLGWPDGQPHQAMWGLALSAPVVKLLCLLRTGGALCFLLGYRARLAGILASFCGYAVLAQDAFGFTFTIHLMLLATLTLALADSASVLAVEPTPARAPRSGRWLVHALLISVYFWAAYVKARPDWLDGRTLGLFYQEGMLRGALADLLLGESWRRALAAKAVVATEGLLVGLLAWPRSRGAGMALALLLHGSIEIMAAPDLIGWFMGALLLSFTPLPEEKSVQGSTQL